MRWARSGDPVLSVHILQALGVSNPIERAKLRGATLRAQRVYAGTLVWQWQRPLLLGALVCVVCSAILIAVAVRVGSIV